MGKVDKKGRNTNNKGTYMRLDLMMLPAWRALTPKAQILYVWLRLEYKGDRYNNNGRIRLSYRQAAQRIGVSINTAADGFRDLQAKGFIVVTQRGSLGIEGEARGPCYELTELQMPRSANKPPRCLYLKWDAERPFEVVRHNVNNPCGRNGKPNSPSSIVR